MSPLLYQLSYTATPRSRMDIPHGTRFRQFRCSGIVNELLNIDTSRLPRSVIPDIFNRESSVFAFSSVREDAGRHAGRPLPQKDKDPGFLLSQE